MSDVIGGGNNKFNFQKLDSNKKFTNFFDVPTINSFNQKTDISYFGVNNSDAENNYPQMQLDEYLDLLKDYGVTVEDLTRVKNSEITLQELLIEIDKDPNKVRLIQQNSFLKQINQNFEKQYDSYSDFASDVNSEKDKLISLVNEKNNLNDNGREYDELQWFCNRLKQGEDLDYLLDSAACFKYKDEYGNTVYIYPDVKDGFLNYNGEIYEKKAEEVTFKEYFQNSELFNELKSTLSQEKRWTLLGKKDFTLYTGTDEQNAIFSKIEQLYKDNYDNRKKQLEEYDRNIENQKKYSEKLSATKDYVDNQVEYYINNIHAYTSKDDFLEKSTYDKSKNQVLTKHIYKISKNKNDIVDFYSCLINGEIVEKGGVLQDKNGKYVCDINQLSTIDNLLDNYLKWEPLISNTEKDIFNYILNTGGTDKAYEYLENISAELDNRWLADKCQKDKEFAQEHEVLASIGSIFLTPIEGLNAAAYSLNSKITGEEIHRSDVYSKGNVWRQSVSEEIHEYNSAWGFIYDTGMSMADSGLLIAASVATGGAASAVLSATLMGSRAYVSTLNDALDRGLSDNQAILLAASSAIVETAMENYSVGHLMNLEEKLGENTLKLTGKIGSKINDPRIANLVEKSMYILASSASQGIAEGEEEFCTELLNYGLDIFISKDLSNYAQSMERYISEGKSEDKALLLTMKDFGGQLIQAFLGGFASGACFGAFGSANSTKKTSYAISNNMYTKYLGDNVSFYDAIDFNRQQIENLQYASNEFSNLQKNNATYTVDLTSLTADQIDLLNNGTIEQQVGKEIKTNISNNISNVVETIGNQQIGTSGMFTVKDFAMVLPDIGINIFNLAGRKSLGSKITAEQNQQVLNKIKEEGIVHITSEESAGLILDSNYVKKTKAGIQSYGAAKSFFFAGTPTIEGVAFNLDSLKTVITGVRIQPTDVQMNDLKVRYSDGSIFNKGDFNFESGQAEQVYYGLTFEDGNLVYKEITAEQAQNYQPDITSEQLKILQNKWALGLKTFISGIQADRIKLLSDIKNYKGTSIYNEVTEQISDVEINNYQSAEQIFNDFKFNAESDINVVNFVDSVLKNSISNGDLNVQKVLNFLSSQNIKFSSDSSISKWENSTNTIYITDDIINNGNLHVVVHEISHMLFDKVLGNTQYNAFTGNELWNSIITDAQNYASNYSNGALQQNGKMLNDLFEYATEQAKSKLLSEDDFIENKLNDYKNGRISELLIKNNITNENINTVSDSVLEYFAQIEYDIAVKEIKSSFNEYQNIQSISDITDAVFKGNHVDLNGNSFGLYGLHGAEYYNVNGAAAHEIVANFFQIKLTGTEADLNLIKNTFGAKFYNTLDMLYNYVMEHCDSVESLEVAGQIEIPKLVSENTEVNSDEILETNEKNIVKNNFALQNPNFYNEFSSISDFSSSINMNGLLNGTTTVISFGNTTIDFGTSSKNICTELNSLGIISENVSNLTSNQISEICDMLSYYSKRIVGVDYVFDEASKFLEDYQLKVSELNSDNVIGKVNLFNEYMVNLSNLIIENNNLNVDIFETIDSKKLSTSSVNDVDYSFTLDEKKVIVDVLQKTNNLKDLSFLSNMDYSDKLILKKYLKSGAAKTLLTINQEQFNALFSYMSGSYKYINNYLDTGIDCDLSFGLKTSDAVRLIDEVMFNNTTEETCILQRIATISDFDGLSLEKLPGKILIHNRNRSSCNGNISTVGTERGGIPIGAKDGEQRVKIDYICPDGTRAVNLGMITSNDVENEIMLGRNQRIRYDSVKMDGDIACVLAVVLPDGVSDNVSIRDLVDAKTYDLISSRYDLSENVEILEVQSTNTSNLLTANKKHFDQVLDNIEQNAGQDFIKDLNIEEFQEVLSKVSKDKYLTFSSILSEDIILNTMNKINQESYDKLVDIILSNPYDTFVLSRNEKFLNTFVSRTNDNTLLQVIESNSNFALKLFNRIDTTKLNYLLSSIENKNCFDDIFKHFYKDEIMMDSEIEAINVYNILYENGFATDIVNDYFSWLAKDNAYNINVSYKTSVENNNGVYSIRRTDGTNFNLKYLNTQELSNGNTIYAYEYSFENYGQTSSVILYVDFDLSFMLDENLNIEQLVNDFLSVECLEQSINEYGYLGTYKLNSGKYEQVINKENIGLIINETANQYYDFLNTYYDLNAGNTFGVDQHSTANMAKVNPKAFKELCKKFVSKGLSYRDAIKVMKSLDNTGACSYASVCNTIFGFYKDNPQAFKSDFGFDMFMYNSEYNYYSLNTTELLADLYLYINNKSNNPNAKLFEGIDKIKIVDKTWLGDIKTDNQQYLSGGWGVRVDLINKYLQSKNKSLDFNSEMLHYGQTINNLNDLEISEVRKRIGDALASGKTIGLGICTDIYDKQGKPIKKGNVRFINVDGSVCVDTNSWSEGAGHAVFITCVVENGVWVSSWGKKLYIPFSDLQNASFTLSTNSITGING